MAQLIPLWRTDLCLQTEEGTIRVPVEMKRGYFRGTLSRPGSSECCMASRSKMLEEGRGFRSRFLPRAVTFMDLRRDKRHPEWNPSQSGRGNKRTGDGAGTTEMCSSPHGREKGGLGGGVQLPSGDRIKALTTLEEYKYLGVESGRRKKG